MWIQITIIAIVSVVFFLRLGMSFRRSSPGPTISEQDS